MKRKPLAIVLAVVLFLAALGMTLYPIISNYVNQKYASEIHTAYQEVMQQTDDSTLQEARQLAIACSFAFSSSLLSVCWITS